MGGLLLARRAHEPVLDLLPAAGAIDDAGPVLHVPGAGCLALSRDRLRVMREVARVGVRREHWLMTPGEGADGLHARIERVEPLAGLARVHCRLRGSSTASVVVETAWPGSETLPRGLRVRLQVRPWDLVLFDARGQRLGT